VLQAVQFCLGVSAAKTGRAGANINFIRSGSDTAKVGLGLQQMQLGQHALAAVLHAHVRYHKDLATTPLYCLRNEILYCQVSVTLWNTGDDAYRPDVYGQFITITRKVGAGAGYLMTGERGNIVSRVRDEMLSIIDHLSIDAGVRHNFVKVVLTRCVCLLIWTMEDASICEGAATAGCGAAQR
jgi:hypothetical protein